MKNDWPASNSENQIKEKIEIIKDINKLKLAFLEEVPLNTTFRYKGGWWRRISFVACFLDWEMTKETNLSLLKINQSNSRDLCIISLDVKCNGPLI